jgi:hypothetical protein
LFFVFKGSPVSMVATLKNIYRPAIASIAMGIVLLLTYSFLSSFHVALQMALSIPLGGIFYLGTWMLFPGGYKNIVDLISYPLSVLRSKQTATK